MSGNKQITFAKVDPDERLVFGWAYVSHDEDGLAIVDNEGDYVPTTADLEKAAYGFMLDHRSADLWHNNEVVAKCVESVVFTPDKLAKMGIPAGSMPQGAWWCGWKVVDDTVWKMVKRGDLAAFSIGGRGRRTPVVAKSDRKGLKLISEARRKNLKRIAEGKRPSKKGGEAARLPAGRTPLTRDKKKDERTEKAKKLARSIKEKS